MKRMTFALAGACLSFAVPSFALAEGAHGHSHGGHGHGGGQASSSGSQGQAHQVSRTIAVAMGDNYYEPMSISVRPGETVRFVISNQGYAVHEFNIGDAAAHAAHQEEMEMMVDHGVIDFDVINYDLMKMEMLDENGRRHTMEHDDPNSVLVEPGKSAEIIWTFPHGGSLEFACNLPGHYESGMTGPITIR